MTTVPFELFGGLHSVLSTKGLVWDEGDYLFLEYQSHGFMGAYRSRVRQVKVPLADLAGVKFDAPWLGGWAKITLRSNRLAPLADVPTAAQGRLVLYVRRDDRDAARKFFDGLHVPIDEGSSAPTLPPQRGDRK